MRDGVSEIEGHDRSRVRGVVKRCRRALGGAALALGLIGWAVVPAAEEGTWRAVGAEINAPYADVDFDRWRQTFERPGREVFDRRAEILSATGVRPGMRVADVGAGTGLFTLLFARAVAPGGRVVAVDVSPGFVENILRRAAAQGLDQVSARVGSQQSTGLDPASLDLVFVCDTYHHFEYPGAVLASIAAALRPAGELVIIDFRRVAGANSPWVLSHVRGDRDQVVREVSEAGFILVEEVDLLRESFFLRFRKGENTNPLPRE
jgi:SAM-dependent methyltransferase